MKKIYSGLVFLLIALTSFNSQAQLFNKAAKEIKKAEELIAKKDFTAALKSLDVALDLSKGKDDYQVFYLKGFCEFNLGQYERAIEQFNYAVSKVNSKESLPIKTDPQVVDALMHRAKSYEALKNFPSAIRDLQLLASIKDNANIKSMAYFKWAADLYEMEPTQNHDKCELLATKSIEVNNKNSGALKLLAQLAVDDRSYADAIPFLEKSIALETDGSEKANGRALLGLCQYKTDKKEDALKMFQLAIDQAPESTKWKTYQHLANLVIINRLYDPSLLEQAKTWANRAAILSDECSNKITLAYMQVLNNKLTEASETLKNVGACDNKTLKMSFTSVSTLIADLLVAKTNLKVKIYGNNMWYYWGALKANLAEGKGKALSTNYLYEVKDATFLKGVMTAGTLINIAEGWNYTGSFLNGVLAGSGKITYAGGEVFTGKFANNEPNGLGKWVYPDSSSYEGTVIAGKPDGIGTFKQKNGLVYQGGFKDGRFHGAGVIVQNGVKENVNFNNGQRNDPAYLAKLQAEQEKQQEAQALAVQKMKEEELAKAEKRNKTGKLFGKALALAGGAVAIKQAVDLGMDTKNAGELGAALLSDVIGDGKDNKFVSALALKGATGNLGNNSILSNTANNMQLMNVINGNAGGTDVQGGGGFDTFSEGDYTSSDGYVTFHLKKQGTNLAIVEPNTTSVYAPVGGNVYSFTNARATYMIKIVNSTTIVSYKKGSENQTTTFTFSGGAEPAPSSGQFTEYTAIAEKYKQKMTSDPKDAQLWAFCAAAANAKRTFNDSGYQDYVRKVVSSMKQIVVNPAKCPCEDAIPAAIWNSVK